MLPTPNPPTKNKETGNVGTMIRDDMENKPETASPEPD